MSDFEYRHGLYIDQIVSVASLSDIAGTHLQPYIAAFAFDSAVLVQWFDASSAAYHVWSIY
jgi:hypothetical protein